MNLGCAVPYGYGRHVESGDNPSCCKSFAGVRSVCVVVSAVKVHGFPRVNGDDIHDAVMVGHNRSSAEAR